MNDSIVLTLEGNPSSRNLAGVFQDSDDRILKALYTVSSWEGNLRCVNGRVSTGTQYVRDYAVLAGSTGRVSVRLSAGIEEVVVDIRPDIPIIRTLMYTFTFALAGLLGMLLHPGLRAQFYGFTEDGSYNMTMGIVIGLMILVSLTMFIPDLVGSLFHQLFPKNWNRTELLSEAIHDELLRTLTENNPLVRKTPSPGPQRLQKTDRRVP